ncbi:MAG: hypothetical protein AAF611_06290 [Bacteroidota bacterium]
MSNFKLYTLKENSKGELHVFQSKKDDAGECLTDSMSICKKMRYNETITTHFVCQPETFTRIKLAEIGKRVCGICAGYLYSNY